MINGLILILILANIFAKSPITSTTIELDKTVPFDYDNYQFSFDYTEDNTYFFISIVSDDKFDYEINCTNQYTEIGSILGSVGAFFIIKALNAGTCDIKFIGRGWPSEMSGTFFFFFLKNAIEVDFNKQETYSVGFLVECKDGECPLLTYFFSNVEQDYNVKLEYAENTLVILDGVSHILSNPYKICEGSDCKENIKEVSFKKGKEYKIIIKYEKIQGVIGPKYYFPPFNFHKTSEDPETDDSDGKSDHSYSSRINISIISLILSLLL